MTKKELPFDVDKYEKLADGNPFVDGTDALANQLSHVISFQNIRDEIDPKSGQGKGDVFFKAFITAFNETYSPNFNSNEVFGRTDPIYQYKNTQRKITLAFKTLASTQSEAYENLGRIQKLIQMLYPSYKSVTNALSLSEAPLVRLKVMNLLRSQKSFSALAGAGKTASSFLVEYSSTAAPDLGLLGVIESCTVNHNLEGSDGVFHKTTTVAQDPDTGAPAETRAEPNTILPKFIDVSISFAPIHEETLGYIDNQPINASFPYGVHLFEDDAEVNIPVGVEERVELSRDLEEARQQAASAQQKLDKKKAAFLKTNKKNGMSRKEGLTKEQEKIIKAYDTAVRASDIALQEAQTAYDTATETDIDLIPY